MQYDFDRVVDRRATDSVKWNNAEMLAYGADTLPFWVADMDFTVAEPIRRALAARVEHAVFGYAVTPESYFSAVCGWYARRHNWQINPETICFSPGVVAGVSYLLALLTEPGNGVIIQPPVYHVFARQIAEAGRRVVDNPLRLGADGRYEMDFADLAQKAADPNNKVMVLCSPHNPAGRVWREDELRRLGEICFANDVFVISDEIHNDLLRDGVRHICFPTLFPAEKNRIVTCVSASKTFNLAAFECASVIIADNTLRQRYQEYLQKTIRLHGPSALAAVATTAAYAEGEEWLTQLNQYLEHSLDWLADFVSAQLPAARLIPCDGTYLAWLDVSAYAPDTAALCKRLLAEAHVYFEEGELFGTGGAGFLRINIACPLSMLREGMARLASFLLQEQNGR